ncbi:MAG: DUF1330 domain-containing protein [Pseudomonadota bacterium]
MHVGWTKTAWQAFKQNQRPGPIHMLNLVRFREWAEYEDGREITGEAAYAEYGRLSGPIFSALGGRIVWRGRPEVMLIGPENEQWDLAFIAEYPSVDSFVQMMRDPEYQSAVEHRTAGLSDSRLVRMETMETGLQFAG